MCSRIATRFAAGASQASQAARILKPSKGAPVTRYSAIAFVLLAACSADAADKTVDRTFSVLPGGVLIVDADSASVRVSGGDINQVTVRMSVRGSEKDLGTAKLDAFQKDDGVTVTMRRRGNQGWFNWRSWSGDGRIEVTVPRRYGVNIRTSGGSVELTDTTGPATLHTSGGNIVAKRVNGNLEAQTSGGGILADTIRGDVDADTSGGDIRLLRIDGKIRGQTSGGGVHCSLVGLNRGISVTTSGGSIELALPRATAANIEAITSGGDFSSDLPVTTQKWQDGHFKGSMNGGGQPIDARTSGGGISLREAN
jgi:DUF4097 and DUF4098 domain-containing protein YvlB